MHTRSHPERTTGHKGRGHYPSRGDGRRTRYTSCNSCGPSHPMDTTLQKTTKTEESKTCRPPRNSMVTEPGLKPEKIPCISSSMGMPPNFPPSNTNSHMFVDCSKVSLGSGATLHQGNRHRPGRYPSHAGYSGTSLWGPRPYRNSHPSPTEP